MSTVEYFMVFIGASMMAGLIFVGLYQSEKKKTGKAPSGQTTIAWAFLCMAGVMSLVTLIQIADGYHVSNDEHMRELGIE